MKMVTLQGSSVVIKSFHATTNQMGCRARERALLLRKRLGSSSKEPRPQGGALKPKLLKPRTEIPKSLDPELSSGPGSG